MATSLRILQVSPAFEPHIGGVESAVRETVRRLVQRGHRVDVLTADETHRLQPSEQLHGARVTRVRAWPRDGDQRLAPAIARAVAREPYDVVHVQCYQTFVAPLAMLAARRARLPYVVTFHGGGHSAAYRNAIRATQLRLLRPLLARAHALIATARWEIGFYGDLLRLPSSRFALVPNGSDLAAVGAPAAVAPGTIVSIGRAERYKGHQHAIRALPHVLAELPHARLWIAGEGPYADRLRALATELGIDEHVEIGVESDPSAYAARLAGCSLGVLFSEFETHPLAVIEAAALGVPLLVAQTRGLSELVADGIASGAELGAGPRAHADAMIGLLRAPRRPAGAIELPTWDEGVDRLEALYRRAAGDRPAQGKLTTARAA